MLSLVGGPRVGSFLLFLRYPTNVHTYSVEKTLPKSVERCHRHCWSCRLEPTFFSLSSSSSALDVVEKNHCCGPRCRGVFMRTHCRSVATASVTFGVATVAMVVDPAVLTRPPAKYSAPFHIHYQTWTLHSRHKQCCTQSHYCSHIPQRSRVVIHRVFTAASRTSHGFIVPLSRSTNADVQFHELIPNCYIS